MSAVSRMTRASSSIETNKLSVMLFELLYYAFKNDSKCTLPILGTVSIGVVLLFKFY